MRGHDLYIRTAMELRQQRVVLETERYRIRGSVTLPVAGYRSRLSDFLNHDDMSFIPLSEVVLEPLDGNGAAEQREFVAVGRQHIVLAVPEGDSPGGA
jgi:hypothetical protein